MQVHVFTPKKRRKKPNGKGTKRSIASATTRYKKKKSNKRGPIRQWTEEQKEIRDMIDVFIENAARGIINARANNTKNKPGKKPTFPYGLYKKKVDAINTLQNRT